MHVLLVNMHGADRAVGGAEGYVADLAAGLASEGATVSLLAAFPGTADGPFERILTLHDEDWRRSTTRRVRNRIGDFDARPTARLEAAVATLRPDLVHTNNLPGTTTGIWEACARLGVPVVHTLHDYYLLCARSTLVRADGKECRPSALLCGTRERRLARWARSVREVIGVSAYILDRHRAFFPAGVGRRVIRHAIEGPSQAGTPPPSGELRTIGYLGALDVVKGVGALLEALPGLAAAGVDVHVAGDGRLRDQVTRAAAGGTGVHYHGVVAGDAKSAFLRGCDAGIVPSVWAEPGAPPYAAVEWLSVGRPVLASGRGGLGEAASRFPGLIPVQPDARGIEAAVRELRRPGRWAEAVEAASAPVGERGDRVRWLEDHLAVYRTAVGAT